jgi:menaquinone-dependent protoporphyrinogen IX oxidase
VAWTTQFVPPNLQELLARHLDESAQWYEVSSRLSVSSYDIEDYDKAVVNAKLMRRIFRTGTAMFYVWKEGGCLREQRLF